MNLELLHNLRSQGLWLRRINIRQVEGRGFQEVSEEPFRAFKKAVREEIDTILLQEMFPLGTKLSDVWWEAHENRIRRPEQVLDSSHRAELIRGKAGITFGRQIGAYPILVGLPYLVPLEAGSDIIVTGHGARSISGVETNLSINKATQSQLEAVPGIGKKAAWRIVSARAKASRKSKIPFDSVEAAFQAAGIQTPEVAKQVFSI